MDTGNTGFIMICAALVFIMTPGLAFFYGGLVRRKNVVNTMMACVAIMGLSVFMWTLFGYSLAFGSDHGGVIGSLEWLGLNGVGWDAGPYSDSIPHLVYCAFQMMFAMITPALITGAVVGRMKFKALFVFIALWSVIVYYPMAHMVWGQGGFLAEIGSVDFAGGNVVHISSGVSALVLAVYLGRRRGYEKTSYRIHNIPFVVLGAALLWFGWYGFNAGSALAADGLAAHAFMTTSISAATALLSWMLIDTVKDGKPTLVGASTGLVVGLVAITPGAGFVPGHGFQAVFDILRGSAPVQEPGQKVPGRSFAEYSQSLPVLLVLCGRFFNIHRIQKHGPEVFRQLPRLLGNVELTETIGASVPGNCGQVCHAIAGRPECEGRISEYGEQLLVHLAQPCKKPYSEKRTLPS